MNREPEWALGQLRCPIEGQTRFLWGQKVGSLRENGAAPACPVLIRSSKGDTVTSRPAASLRASRPHIEPRHSSRLSRFRCTAPHPLSLVLTCKIEFGTVDSLSSHAAHLLSCRWAAAAGPGCWPERRVQTRSGLSGVSYGAPAGRRRRPGGGRMAKPGCGRRRNGRRSEQSWSLVASSRRPPTAGLWHAAERDRQQRDK